MVAACARGLAITKPEPSRPRPSRSQYIRGPAQQYDCYPLAHAPYRVFLVDILTELGAAAGVEVQLWLYSNPLIFEFYCGYGLFDAGLGPDSAGRIGEEGL